VIIRWPHVVTILTPSSADVTTDTYGNQVTSWDAVNPVVVQGFFQPRPGDEVVNMANYQIGDAVLFAPASTVITGDSRVVAQGQTFEVQGPPEIWQTASPLDHVRAVLRVVTG
jgi:hypothetical protein